MGNLALHSAEEPDNRRAITGTAEVPTKRDNDAALALGARPMQQHEPAARHDIRNPNENFNLNIVNVFENLKGKKLDLLYSRSSLTQIFKRRRRTTSSGRSLCGVYTMIHVRRTPVRRMHDLYIYHTYFALF